MRCRKAAGRRRRPHRLDDKHDSRAAHDWIFKLDGWPHAPVWGEAELVGPGESGISKPGVSDGCPHETADGLSLLIPSNREDPNDIWAADRASIKDPWSEPRKLEAPVNSAAGDFCPTPVRGRSLMFVSTRPGACPGEQSGGGDIYISRQSPVGAGASPFIWNALPTVRIRPGANAVHRWSRRLTDPSCSTRRTAT